MGLSRRRFSRRALLASTTLLGAAAVAGCANKVAGQAGPDPDDLKKVSATPTRASLPDEVTMIVVAYQPYTVKNGSGLSGPVPDIARKVLTDLGVRAVKFTVIDDQQKILTMVAAGALELAGGLTIQPQLCGSLTFSTPDYVSGTALAVPAGNPKGLKTLADVVAQGAAVGVMTGLPEQTDAARAGVPTDHVRLAPEPVSGLEMVKTGQADCFAFDELSLRELVKSNGQGLEVTAAFMPDGRLPLVGAYAFAQDSPLVEPFNQALKELHDSGEWLRMVKPFGLKEDNEPPADLTTEKACAG
ncbi:transporter substrate-binding domain-containing protein [Actinophytocola sp.]|uniref:transporter substrate-binding domain-containing protein n=1 Tax=Actinophytocola sp. TaxID=1872138 RepID=UPI00389AE6B1